MNYRSGRLQAQSKSIWQFTFIFSSIYYIDLVLFLFQDTLIRFCRASKPQFQANDYTVLHGILLTILQFFWIFEMHHQAKKCSVQSFAAYQFIIDFQIGDGWKAFICLSLTARHQHSYWFFHQWRNILFSPTRRRLWMRCLKSIQLFRLPSFQTFEKSLKKLGCHFLCQWKYHGLKIISWK